MNDDYGQPGVGGELGSEATAHIEHRGAEYCNAERQRIDLANQPKIFALRAKIATLQESAKEIEDRIRLAPPPSEEQQRKKKARFYWTVTVLLSIAGFVFSAIAFEPFRLGWKAWLYCVGIAVVTPFLVEKFLELWASPQVIKALTTAACISAITSIVLLAVIRGDLLTEQLSHSNPVATVEGDASPQETQSTFYERTLGYLRFLMALLAIAMEVGAGIALYEARRWSGTGENGSTLREKLAALRNEMIEHAHALRLLENEGAMFESQFWRDFYRSLLNGVKRSAAHNLPLIIMGLALLASVRAFAADRLDVVVLVDLSKSVAAKDHDNKAEFQKNIDGVTHVLASMPADSRVAVYGITSDSFGRPYPLLTAQLTDDEGYFKERLAKGRAELIRTWRERSLKLQPEFPHTDLLGAFLVASQQFATTKGDRRKVLIVFSDMRQSTPLLDLERGDRVLHRQSESLSRAQNGFPANLRGVEVYALGVDASGVSFAYWRALREFWLQYFRRAGAVVLNYSILREVPKLER